MDKIEFKDFLGTFYLGSDYSPDIWDEINSGDVKSHSLLIHSFSDSIKDNIYNIINRNLKIDGNFVERNVTYEVDNCIVNVPFIIYDNKEEKDKKVISEIVIVSHSTSLKFNATLKALFTYKIMMKLGFKIKKFLIATINNKIRNDFQEMTFDFHEEINIRNSKNINEKSFLNINFIELVSADDIFKIEFYLPRNNKGNAIDYHVRAIKEFDKLNKTFWDKIDMIKRGIPFDPFCLTNDIVRKNGSNKWITIPDFFNFTKKTEIDLKNPEYSFDIYELFSNPNFANNQFTKSTRVYFDFETISFQFSAFKKTFSYQQIPVQYSVIKTDSNNNIISSTDVVYDFMNYSHKSLWKYCKKMIDDIYEEGGVFIAHNKVFENESLTYFLYGFSDEDEFDEYVNKCLYITSEKNSIDTNVIFRKCFDFDGFEGKSSIKYINGWISENKPYLKERYSIEDYGDLELQNGLAAQAELSKLYFGMYTKSEYSLKITDLKKYCHNDVKTMLSVMDLIEEQKGVS